MLVLRKGSSFDATAGARISGVFRAAEFSVMKSGQLHMQHERRHVLLALAALSASLAFGLQIPDRSTQGRSRSSEPEFLVVDGWIVKATDFQKGADVAA
jgi:hypothetical protein